MTKQDWFSLLTTIFSFVTSIAIAYWGIRVARELDESAQTIRGFDTLLNNVGKQSEKLDSQLEILGRQLELSTEAQRLANIDIKLKDEADANRLYATNTRIALTSIQLRHPSTQKDLVLELTDLFEKEMDNPFLLKDATSTKYWFIAHRHLHTISYADVKELGKDSNKDIQANGQVVSTVNTSKIMIFRYINEQYPKFKDIPLYY